MSPRLSMPNRLAAILLCFAFQAHAGITANTFRHPGAPLDPSLKNEADHAASQASLWLVARQSPDGSWGATDRVRLTSSEGMSDSFLVVGIFAVGAAAIKFFGSSNSGDGGVSLKRPPSIHEAAGGQASLSGLTTTAKALGYPIYDLDPQGDASRWCKRAAHPCTSLANEPWEAVKLALDRIATSSSPTVVDCPPGHDPRSLSGAALARLTGLVAGDGDSDLVALGRGLEYLKRLRASGNPDLTVAVALNKVNPNTTLAKQAIQGLRGASSSKGYHFLGAVANRISIRQSFGSGTSAISTGGRQPKAPTHPPQVVLGPGKGAGFPAGFRSAERALLALRVHKERARARPPGPHPSHPLGLRLENAWRSPHNPLSPGAAS